MKHILSQKWARLLLFALLYVVICHGKVYAQQKNTISGKITSNTDGTALIGATIAEKGSTNGTTSDVDGNFKLAVSPNATVVVSFIGYNFQEVKVNNQSIINVKLEADMQQLKDVVVVGYGTQKRKDLTGSIVNLSGKDLLPVPSASFDQMMQGKVAGVQITQTSGAPGGNVNVLVRGVSSITGGNQPLYVVDGYAIGSGGGGSDMSSYNSNSYTSGGMAGNTATKINPLSIINPSDIESIEILKDASATAIYGSRGANGVVLITTKRGKNGKATINFEASSGIQQLAKKLDVLNPKEFAEFVANGRDNAWVYAGGKATDPNSVRSIATQVKPEYRNPESLSEKGTDWQDAIFRTASVHNYQLSANGGNNDINYYISGGYYDQEGIITGSNFKKFTFRTNIDAYLSKRVKIGSSVAGSYSFGDFARAEGHLGERGLISMGLASSPTIPVYNQNGSLYSELLNPLGIPIENPLLVVNEFSDKRSSANIFTNNYLELQLAEGFVFKTSIGVNYTNSNTNLWKSSKIGAFGSETAPATAGSNVVKSLNWLNENTLSYRSAFGEDHAINGLVGFTAQKNSDNIMQAGATDFPTDYIHTITGGIVNAGTNYVSEWSMLSVLARLNYTFKGKYLLTATVRRDGSSRFGANNKWGTFPSVSLGYRLSDETFIKNIKFISDLKFRASYGISGNNLIGNYAQIGLLSTNQYVTSTGTVLGVSPASLANDNLMWEKSFQTNIGLDAALLNGRLSFTVDAYKNHKKDLLLNSLLPFASGFTSSTQNIGELENKGIEAAINTEIVRKENFNWNVNFNVSANRNKVLALSSSSSRIINSDYQISQVGSPISSFYLLHVTGIFQNTEEVKSNPVQHPNTQPGDLKFEDADGNGTITNSDKTIVGNPWPKYTWGFNNRFSYKNLTLSVSLVGSQGNDVYFQGGEINLNSAGVQNQLGLVAKRWKSESDPGDGIVPRAIRNDYAKGLSATSRYLFDGSYTRIRNINLAFSIPAPVLAKLHLNALSIYADVTNAFTFTKYPSYDPEGSIGGDNVTKAGVDYFAYPVPRIFTLGLRMSIK